MGTIWKNLEKRQLHSQLHSNCIQTLASLRVGTVALPFRSNGIMQHGYNELAKLAKKEHDEDQRPAIKNAIPVGDYDTVFLGYPMWWYTFPMIIYTLFDQVDFSGKTLIPFNTHMGSGDGGTYKTVKRLAPNATVLDGLTVEMTRAERGDAEHIAKWLKSIKQI